MAATRLIALHINKGKNIAQCLRDRTDYAKNPEKTEKGELVTGYECDPMTADEEFLLSKRQYNHITGRKQRCNVIAYQIRQSFKPGEITPEEANKVGYELGMRFTKGKHAFLVATHIDRAHIHNHIIFNSTTLDCKRKFRDFHNSGLALQKLSDIICVEHGLSIIEKKPYAQRVRRADYPRRRSFRDEIRNSIDGILEKKPKDFETFLCLLEQEGYSCKRGKYISLRKEGQQSYIRLRSLRDGYTEEDIRSIFQGKKAVQSRSKKIQTSNPRKINLLVDIDEKLQAKGPGYQRWATVYNLKHMAQTILFLKEHKIEELEQLEARAKQETEEFNQLQEKMKSAEERLTEIAALKKHIINYAKTRDVYAEYRKSGYSSTFYESHMQEIVLHKLARIAFDKAGMKKLPKIKELTAEYAEVLAEKKAAYAEYQERRPYIRELLKVKKNVEQFLEMEKEGERGILEDRRKSRV